MKMLLTSMVLGSVILASPVFADTEKYDGQVHTEADEKGNLTRETKEAYTDVKGTAHTSVIQEDVKVKGEGKSVSKVVTKTTTDPKGLGNKSWTDGTSSVEARKDGSEVRVVDSKSVDAAGTAKRAHFEEKTAAMSDGTAKTISQETAVIDPQGLMNKRIASTKVTTIEHPTGTTDIITERNVDGKQVSIEKITR